MSLFSPSALRMILEHETQANAPVNEETTSQVRENIEALLMMMAYTGTSGSLTSNPPNDTTGQVSDSARNFGPNEHDGRSLVVTSGAAKGNIYPITLTLNFVMGSHDLESAGNNLYADGLRSGDAYMIFYSLAHLEAHTHDGVDSAGIEAPKSLAGNYVETTGLATNKSGAQQVGPTGYTYERKLAWKLGRGGVYRLRANGYRQGVFAKNGAPIGTHMDFGLTGGSLTQDISGFLAGDLLEFYCYTHALINDTWSINVMTDNPAYDPKPLLSSEL